METKLITEKDVKNSWLYYYIVAEMGISYERLQALGFTTALLPILQKLYPDQEDLKQAIKRHWSFITPRQYTAHRLTALLLQWKSKRHVAQILMTTP